MSGDPHPGFTLDTSKKRSSKAAKLAVMSAAMSATAALSVAMLAVESTAKSAAVRGTAEGQSPEKGKAKSSGLDSSWEGPSRPENSVSEETRLAVGRNGCHKCKSGHHCRLSNEVKIWVKAKVKIGKTLDGTQAKRGIKFLGNSKKSPGLKETATVFKGNVLYY